MFSPSSLRSRRTVGCGAAPFLGITGAIIYIKLQKSKDRISYAPPNGLRVKGTPHPTELHSGVPPAAMIMALTCSSTVSSNAGSVPRNTSVVP